MKQLMRILSFWLVRNLSDLLSVYMHSEEGVSDKRE